MSDLIHVVPLNDLREHETSITCWCHPTPDEEEPCVIVHHSLDQREKYESGELRDASGQEEKRAYLCALS